MTENWQHDWESEDHDDDDSSADQVACPECGEFIFDDAPQCPYCGQYVVHQQSVWEGRSWWWIALGLLGMIAVILALALGP